MNCDLFPTTSYDKKTRYQIRESKIEKQKFSRERCGISDFRDPEYWESESRKKTKLSTRNENSGFPNPKY